MPAISSTPAVEIQPSKNKSQKSAKPLSPEKKNEVSAKTPMTIDDFENSYLGYLMNSNGIGQLPLSPPKKSRQAISSPKPPALANVSCGIQTTCSLPVNPEQNEVVATDELVESAVPTKLKPTGAGKTTKHQLRTQTDRESSSDNDELVLDLQKSRHRKRIIAFDKAKTKSALNKPSHPEINGEQFAKELAKMSNYEIIDLRKRNSLGMLKGQLSKDQQVVEQQIQHEISRRKLENNESIILKTVDQKSSQESVSSVADLKRRTTRQRLQMVR